MGVWRSGKWRDLTGKKFNLLTVVSVATERSPYRWNCVCECGGTAVVSGPNLKMGHTRSCGCYRNDMVRRAISKKPFEALYNAFKSRCVRLNRESMSFEDFLTFTEIQECRYCGDPIVWAKYINHKKGNYLGYNLDRIDSKRGYSKDNCAVCCPECNHIKWDMDYGKFIEKILRIARRIERGEL